MRLFPRSLFRQNLLLIVALIVLGQLLAGLLFVYAVQKPRATLLAGLLAQQVKAVQAAAAGMDEEARAAFIREMNAAAELHILPAASVSLDETGFSAFAEPRGPAVRIFVRELRRALGERVELVRWQEEGRRLWIGLLLGEEPYWLQLRAGDLVPGAPWALVALSAISTLLALTGAYAISRRINRPLRRLVEAAQCVGQGRQPPRLAEGGASEIATVAASFNQMAENLAAMDRERAIMLAGVSHDVRTPLAKLRLALELSEKRVEPGLYAQMARYTDDIDALLDQFLAFARIGSDEAVAPVDADAIVAEVAASWARQGHVFALSLGAPLPLPVRPQALRRLVANLMDNAVKYGESGLAAASRIEDGCWQLEVSDGGPGIDPGAAERLLQPFVRADSSRQGKPGSGLGLAIVQRIVVLHQGALGFARGADGRGLRVIVRLPLGQEAAS